MLISRRGLQLGIPSWSPVWTCENRHQLGIPSWYCPDNTRGLQLVLTRPSISSGPENTSNSYTSSSTSASINYSKSRDMRYAGTSSGLEERTKIPVPVPARYHLVYLAGSSSGLNLKHAQDIPGQFSEDQFKAIKLAYN